jgi:hypothetical protein
MTLSLDQRISWLFRLNALLNVALSIRGIIDPVGMTAMFGGPVPNYPFLVRLWMGLVFMFGLMFWETSRDVRKKVFLIKYNWIEKTITASAVTLGYVAGDVPGSLMMLIVFTNWLWIPFILYADIRLRRDMQARAHREGDVLGPRERRDSAHLASGSISD